MHICYLNMPIEYYSPLSGGAVATIIMQQAKQLLARGHHVTVLTIINEDEVYPVGEVIPINMGSRTNLSFVQRRFSDVLRKLHHWDYPYYEYYLRSFRQALKALHPSPDVVIVHNDLVSPKYIKQVLPHTKVIVWLHNEQGTRQKKILQTVESVDQFVAVSNYIRDWTAKTYPIPENKLAVVLNGVDTEVFQPREDYLKVSGNLRVLFVGRLNANKGPDIVVDSVFQIKEEGLPVSLTVAGAIWWYGHGKELADPYFRMLKAKMDATGANHLGHVPREQIASVIRSHDVVCVPSRWNEPFGLVILEAMASGCAVVASNRGGMPEACGDAGILVNPDNPNDVTSTLRELATNDQTLITWKQKSITRSVACDWSKNVDKLELLLEKIQIQK